MKKNVLFFTLLLAIFACKKKEPTIWEVDLFGPVIKSTLTVNNILPDSVSKINSDNSVDIDYIFPFSPLKEQFFINIPDTSILQTFPIPFSSVTSLPPGFQFVSNTSENKLELGDAKLEVMKIKTGKIQYKITSQINEKTIYNYEILNSDDGNGNTFKKSFFVPAGTVSSPAIVQGNLLLNGYTFDLTTNTGTKYNILETKISITIDPSGTAVFVSNVDSVFIENSLLNISPEYVRGYLGKSYFVDGPANNKFDIFDKIVDGTIDLDEVEVNTTIKNYVGAEAQIKLSQFSSLNTSTSSIVTLTNSSINTWINLNRATEVGGTIIPNEHVITYNKANSNIDLFFENLPDRYISKVEANINPLGNVSAGNDFLYFNKIVEVDFHLIIPLKLIANNLTLEETIEFGIDKKTNQINYGNATIYATNGFPFDAEIQLYLLDIHNNITDSIAVDGLLASAIIDGSNLVTSPTKSVLKFEVPSSKMAILENNSKMKMRIKFNTKSSTHTTIYKDYKIDIQIVSDFNMDMKY